MLVVDRRTGRASESFRSAMPSPSAEASGASRTQAVFMAYAILGCLAEEGVAGLLIVTGANRVCEVDSKMIYEVTAVERLPLSPPLGHVGDLRGNHLSNTTRLTREFFKSGEECSRSC